MVVNQVQWRIRWLHLSPKFIVCIVWLCDDLATTRECPGSANTIYPLSRDSTAAKWHGQNEARAPSLSFSCPRALERGNIFQPELGSTEDQSRSLITAARITEQNWRSICLKYGTVGDAWNTAKCCKPDPNPA
ncbi:hypothetical protein C8J56DRAFT_169347 [Mycena floridula]|nr:hypothetical protein C8J56DRAFT_169347 [Mycena floridula]